ncbi:MAG: hypothetical protein IPJ86_00960 [Bacteroidetes bacterium]|nr:hypothetical protein [Bacteroidota bacterium]
MKFYGKTVTYIALITILILTSCEKDKGPIIIRPEIPYDSTVYMISYSGYIQPLFNENCVGCHNAAHPFLNLHASVSYSELVYNGENAPYVDNIDPENSLLIQRLRGVEWPIMPPNPPHVSEADIDSIKLWMSQGYFDN